MDPIKEFLFKIADDQLIIGHRNSEWTGMGPLLEEDIAFSSMAQDKVGQSYAIYQMLFDMAEEDPDTLAFIRDSENFRNCTLVELPNGEYDFSLIRHFLFDTAESIRFDMLTNSSFTPLAQLAAKIRGEIRYHTMHANTWIKQLGNANDESITRLQNSLDLAFPYALGIFEPSPVEEEIIAENIFKGEEELQEKWMESITNTLKSTALELPEINTIQPQYGGRTGKHTPHLQPLLNEMGEVFRSDPTAEW